ncbi:hypothetical protein M3Y94_00362900 [Aphelenchoides besseyi]|nr:hypothetical protein M3Y94_00362900 [Aphelenchoides besseyi]KAI6235245.1 Not1 domain, CCR4-Not complex component [Aphelenchoides besseyi]
MAEKRKLLNEMDKCFKKIDEGVEIFEETMDKMNEAHSDNQRDKLQDDLKKEIKKLQRLREQIKGWQNSSDIKDKEKLNQYRKLIEQRMETFKDVERENKTKPHSKQGLSAEEKLDPRMKEKAETLDWLNTQIRKIQDEIDRTESKIESFVTAADTGRKRGKNKDDMKRADKEKVEELKKHLERVKFNLTNLEVCMRLILNEKLEVEEVNNKLRDPLDMYVDALGSEYDDDLATLETMEPDDVYNELNLGDYINQLRVVNCPSTDKEKTTKSPSESPQPEEVPKARNLPVLPSSVPTTRPVVTTHSQPISYAAAASRASPPVRQRNNSVSTSQTTSANVPVSAATPTVSVASSPTSTINVTESTNASIPFTPPSGLPNNPPSYAAVAAANSSSVTPPLSTASTVPTVVEEQERASPPAELSRVQRVDSAKSDDKRLLGPNMNMDELSAAISSMSPEQLRDIVNSEEQTVPKTPQSSVIPPYLGAIPLGVLEPTKEMEAHLHMVDAVASRMPVPSDTEKRRVGNQMIQPSPCYTAPYYPQKMMPNFETLEYYTRLQPETLFFAFYYLEGTKAQLLAAKALKKLAWRYHMKYLQWFQRHQEPQKITDEYERGSYLMFDYEKWTQRKMEDFTFEYKYLEDKDVD